MGLEAEKPKRDIGVDLEVWHSARHDRHVNIKIAECVEAGTKRGFRLFRTITAEQQIEGANAAGLPMNEALQKAAALCDYFILWAENYDEYWVFPKDALSEILDVCSKERGKLKPAADCLQAVIDMDSVDENGSKLTELYADYLYNFQSIKNSLLKK
jgi:hypothetical protein